MPPIDYTNLTGPNGQEDNLGGSQQIVYYAPIRDFDTIIAPVPLATATTDAELVNISTDHIFSTGKMFLTAYTTEDKGELDYEVQGDPDGFSVKPVAKFFYPGAKEEILAFIAKAKNDQFIFMFPLADGTVLQVGSEQFPARIKPKWNSATNSAGVRGAEIEVTQIVASSPVIYSGVISTTPAV